MKNWIYTSLALCAFAGNSVLCRLALGQGLIDPASFTSIRLVSGVLFLLLILIIVASKTNPTSATKGSWKASIMLFLYAAAFSYAYISLDTATGALILFAAVQISIIVINAISGDKLNKAEIVGLIVAFLGLVYLVFPDLSSPTVLGFLLMSLSGIAWGLYTLAGVGSKYPLSDTTYNFLRTLPLVAILLILTIKDIQLSWQGIALAVTSGALASGAGYTVWYMAIKHLSNIQVAVLQLLVPVIAAFGGVIFVNEVFSQRLIIATLLILSGVLIVILGKQQIKNTFQD